MNLMICGNGFDLHHKLKTSYADFYDCLNKNRKDIVDVYNNYYDNINIKEKLWKDVENDIKCLFYQSYTKGKISDKMESFFYNFTGEIFFNWISCVAKNIELICPQKYIEKIIEDSIFINFNYTHTLEVVYKVDKSNICYIHGRLKDLIKRQGELLGNDFQSIDSNLSHTHLQFGYSDSLIDEVKKLGKTKDTIKLNDLECSISKHIYKNKENLKEFVKDKKVDKVIVMGHSVDGDDLYYFNALANTFYNIPWEFYYYDDKSAMEKFKSKYDLNAKFISWKELSK